MKKFGHGVIMDGFLMPLDNNYKFNYYGENKSNQTQPVIFISKGQYAWSETPVSFEIHENETLIDDTLQSVKIGKSGSTLKEVQNFVSKMYFPASEKLPDTLLFSRPQYNTWIELSYNQNQNDVLKYTRSIINNGFPARVIMIDDTWQEDHGLWKFYPGRFLDPKMMIDSLHRMGFKIMLWICSFVSADFEKVIGQFMLGDSILVAPVVNKGSGKKNVKLPAGKWKASNGKILKGGRAYEFDVAIDKSLFFELQN